MLVRADTRTRVSAAQLPLIDLEGRPDAATVTDLADASELEASVDGGRVSVRPRSVPALLRVEWESGGCAVSAELDVVARRYCSPSDVVAWRRDYELSPDEAAAEDAIARAERLIEDECGRSLQPVARLGFVDRPCPARTRAMVSGERGYDPDLRRVTRAVDAAGAPVPVREVGAGPYVDLSALPFGSAARVSYLTGLPEIPADVPAAVCALAAWYLAPKAAPENATSQSTELGVVSFVVAGVSGAPTSLPEVNACIRRHRLVGGGAW